MMNRSIFFISCIIDFAIKYKYNEMNRMTQDQTLRTLRLQFGHLPLDIAPDSLRETYVVIRNNTIPNYHEHMVIVMCNFNEKPM